VLIGLGSIGKRHLESLIKLKHKYRIYLIDKNLEALEFCKKKICKNINIHNFFFSNKITDLPKFIDLAIIATNADIRREITEKLIYQTSIKYIIFEKIVFQSITDFKKIIYFLNKKGIKSWVNCPRRMFPLYKKLKKEINRKPLIMSIKGNNWYMGSNGIHYLDLLSYLNGENKFYLVNSTLHKKIYTSKRKLFYEFGGRFIFKSSGGSTIIFQDDMIGKNLPDITIDLKSKNFLINEEKSIIKKFNNKKKSLIKQTKFEVPLQSNLTHKYVAKIFKYGKIELPSLSESYLIHLPLIKLFNKHLFEVKKTFFLKCPIT
jgi:hypothetical protein